MDGWVEPLADDEFCLVVDCCCAMGFDAPERDEMDATATVEVPFF